MWGCCAPHSRHRYAWRRIGKNVTSVMSKWPYNRIQTIVHKSALKHGNKKVIQKTSQYYVRKNYREGKESSIDSFYTFMKSPGGAKKRNDLASYYKKSANLKQYLHDGKLLHFAVAGLCQLAVSHEARNVVISELKKSL